MFFRILNDINFPVIIPGSQTVLSGGILSGAHQNHAVFQHRKASALACCQNALRLKRAAVCVLDILRLLEIAAGHVDRAEGCVFLPGQEKQLHHGVLRQFPGQLDFCRAACGRRNFCPAAGENFFLVTGANCRHQFGVFLRMVCRLHRLLPERNFVDPVPVRVACFRERRSGNPHRKTQRQHRRQKPFHHFRFLSSQAKSVFTFILSFRDFAVNAGGGFPLCQKISPVFVPLAEALDADSLFPL